MKLLILALAVVAVAHAQSGAYSPFSTRQPQYRRPFVQPKPNPYKPFVFSTPAPPPARSTPFFSTPAYVPTTPAPVFISPTRFEPLVPKYYNADSRSATVLKSGNDINPDGSYNWFFENDNGIVAQAQGLPRTLPGNPPELSQSVQGAFSWTAPNGEPIEFTYIADENGYQPRSAAIPTSPPVPPLIARALEYIATHPAKQ